MNIISVCQMLSENISNNLDEIPMTTDCLKDTWDGSIGSPIAKFIDDLKKN